MKKLVALLLTAVLVLSMLAACGNEEVVETKGDETVAGETTGEVADSTAETEEELAEIVVAFFFNQPHTADGVARVQEAINAITVPQINTSVTLHPLSLGIWNEQISLMISSGEQIDLMPTFYYGPTAFNSMVSQNQLLPIDDVLAEYGSEIISFMRPEYLETTKIDGKTYGVPAGKDAVSNIYLAMRKDILEKYDLVEKANNIKSIEDIEAIYKVVCDNEDMCGIASSGQVGVIAYLPLLFTGALDEAKSYEKLLNDYIVSFADDPFTAQCLYETEAFEEVCRITERWYNEGYIYKDAANTTDDNVQLVRDGRAFSAIYAAENATYLANAGALGHEMVIVRLGSCVVSTGTINTINWVMPVTAEEQEGAMKFLNLMYSNKEIIDLMNFGVEGVDYVVKEDGTYTFPEGITADNAEYFDNLTWLFGNQYLSGVWEGADPDTREVSKQLNENPPVSELLGFVANPANLENQISAITGIYNEYFRGLSCGVYNVDETLPEFRAKLEAAGMDEVVAAVQEQLDAWLAAK